jgi:hypothetical protein
MKMTIEIIITDVVVEDNYYNFNYKVEIDGILSKEEKYSDSHNWNDDKEGFKKILEDDMAFKDVLYNLEIRKK